MEVLNSKPWFIGRPFRQSQIDARLSADPQVTGFAKWSKKIGWELGVPPDRGGAYVQLKRGALGSLWLWHLPVFQEASVVNPGERYRKMCGFPHRTVGLWCLALQHVHSHLLGQGLSPQIEMKTRKTYEKMQKHEPTRPFLWWSCPKKMRKQKLFRMFKTWIQPRLKFFCISDAWMFDEFLGAFCFQHVACVWWEKTRKVPADVQLNNLNLLISIDIYW